MFLKNKFNFLFSLAILALILFPVSVSAQVFAPCDTRNGCIMQQPIVYVGAIPVITGTGSPTVATGSTNTAGIVTAGASATSVIITFGTAYIQAVPNCVVGSQTQLAAFAYVTTKTAITITQTATSGNLINYHCDPMARD